MARNKREQQILHDLQLIKDHLGIQEDTEMQEQERSNPVEGLTDAERDAIERAPDPKPDLRGLPESDNPQEDTGTQGELDELGLTADQSQALRDAGYRDRASLRAASDEELQAVPGVGRATVRNLRDKL
jgi:DNA-directed RNA polymerase alpha subunit